MTKRHTRQQRESGGLWEVVDGRILLSLMAGLFLAAGLTWGLAYLTAATTLPLQAIEIEGDFKKVEASQIQSALSGVELGGLFSVDVEQVRQLTESIAWVEKVSVTRKWPDTLRLNVYEHQAIAHWGKRTLMNNKGDIFIAPEKSYPQGLPHFVGPEGQQLAVLNVFGKMNHLLAPVGLRVTTLSMDARRAWRVNLDNGMELLLGRAERERQLLRFVHVYPKVLSDKASRIRRVDLRYTNGFAVEWKSARADITQPAVGETAYV